MQENRPIALTYVPARQFAHTPSAAPLHPLLQIWPVKQALQATHEVKPLPVWYLPVSQLVQNVDFVLGWYCPGTQSWQVEAVDPVWYLPGGHSWHRVDPVVSWNSPG